MTFAIGHNNPPSDSAILAERLNTQEAALRSTISLIECPQIISNEQEAGNVTDAIKYVSVLIRKIGDAHKAIKEPYLENGRVVDAWKKRLESEFEIKKLAFSKPLNAFLEMRAKEERERQIEAARRERERAERLAEEAKEHEAVGINDTASALMDAAIASEAMASHIEDKVYTSTPSQLAKSRSIHGATASQKLVWTGEIENISAIDFNLLRKYISIDDLQKAINAFIRDGGREINGVKIYQKSQLNVR